MSTGYALRDRAVLATCHRAVTASESTAATPESRRFLAGARAGLEWVLGHASSTPASAAAKPVTLAEMEREERYCDRVIYSPDARPALDRDFANGVEHALSWARGAEDEPPTPYGAAAQPARAVCRCDWQAA